MYEGLYTWHEVDDSLDTNPFDQPDIVGFLTTIGVTVLEARINFRNDYYTALAYTNKLGEIKYLMSSVLAANQDKYDAIIAAYPYNKYVKRVRTPNLTKQMTANAKGTSDIQRKQTETHTETPSSYTTTYTHSVNPFDDPGLKEATKDTSVLSGSKSVATTFTGDPDHTATTSTAGRKDTETGTETVTEATIGSDSRSAAELMQDLGELSTLFDMFKQDIAKKLFLQVWR